MLMRQWGQPNNCVLCCCAPAYTLTASTALPVCCQLICIPVAPAESQNAFIWAAWAYLEAKSGNAREARKLYDASTVADPEHAAAWHGWGLLEKQQGNLLAARDLWLKVLCFFLSPVSCFLLLLTQQCDPVGLCGFPRAPSGWGSGFNADGRFYIS